MPPPGTHRRPHVPDTALALGLALGLLLAAGAAWLLWQHAGDDPSSVRAPSATPSPALADSVAPAAPALPRRESPAAAKLRELGALPETYRNTTFLTAIRDAGFLCYGIESAYGGVNDSATWTVACYDMLAYTVTVDDAGTLVIEPMAQYIDSLTPVVRPGNGAQPPNSAPRR